MGPGPGGMHTALSWKAETSALGKIKRIADRKLGIFHAQHGHAITHEDRKWARSLQSSKAFASADHLAI